MKSIRQIFFNIYIGIIPLFALVIFTAAYYVNITLENQTATVLNSLCSSKVSEINSFFTDMENASALLNSFMRNNVDIKKFQEDEEYAVESCKKISSFVYDISKTILFAKAIYFCMDADRYQNLCFRYFQNNQMGLFRDVSYGLGSDKYKSISSCKWYRNGKNSNKNIWLRQKSDLYSTENSSVLTYISPVFVDGVLLGVIGVDISFKQLRSITDNLNYESGFCFLVDENKNILYHKNFPGGLSADDFYHAEETLELSEFFDSKYFDTGKNYIYKWNEEKHRIILNKLNNGMVLAVSVLEKELFWQKSSMLMKLIFLFSLALILFALFINFSARKIIYPIGILTEAAVRISKGELNTRISNKSDNEFGILADSIEKISVELREYISYIRNLAFNDAMTGIRNKAAYLDSLKIIESRIDDKIANFTVYVFDVNGLKLMNDTMGHEYGDLLIKDTASILRSIFDEKNIYRTGGDEFVAIEESSSKKRLEEVFSNFDKIITDFNLKNDRYKRELSVSKGAAIFDENSDNNYNSVFARADQAMYECKKEFYKVHSEFVR